MGLNLTYGLGQTPIDEDEKADLKIKTISTRPQLDAFEQVNIAQAIQWSMSRKFNRQTILSVEFLKKVHRQMFCDVWKWAGTFRKTNKNIGIDKNLISTALRNLVDDCAFWIDNQTFPETEIAIRFKHRLVAIHPFPNGNGRHSRLLADMIATNIFSKKPFTWGNSELLGDDATRGAYISALREADNANYEKLIRFATSA